MDEMLFAVSQSGLSRNVRCGCVSRSVSNAPPQYPRTIVIDEIPAALSASRMVAMIGTPLTGTSGLGTRSVSGASREPRPAARMTARVTLCAPSLPAVRGTVSSRAPINTAPSCASSSSASSPRCARHAPRPLRSPRRDTPCPPSAARNSLVSGAARPRPPCRRRS